MHALPDETVVHILSFVRDGELLLDSASLVCRRWCALSRDPAAWASVELSVNAKDQDELQRQARVLLRAPALGRLTLKLYEIEDDSAVASALRRSRAAVRHSVDIDCDSLGSAAARGLLDLLGRSRRRLRELSWSWQLQRRALDATDRQGRSPAEVLASLTQVRVLSLSWSANQTVYAGELAACGGLPLLKTLYFEIYDVPVPREVLALWVRMLADLVAGAAASLLELDMNVAMQMEPDAADADALQSSLARCARLESVELCVVDLRQGAQQRAADLARVARFVRGPLPDSLEFLRLHLCLAEADEVAEAETLPAAMAALAAACDALQRRLPRLCLEVEVAEE